MNVSFLTNLVCRIDDEPTFGSMVVTVTENATKGGRMTIESAGPTLGFTWSHTGGASFLQTILDVSVDLMAAELAPQVPQQLFDVTAVARLVKRRILEARRGRAMNPQEARDLYDQCRYIGDDDLTLSDKLVEAVLGKDWWSMAPVKENPEYQRMCEMARVVQKALRLTRGRAPGKVTDEDGERVKAVV